MGGSGAGPLPPQDSCFYGEAAAGIWGCQRKEGWHHQSDIISAAQLLNVAWRDVQGDPMKWVRAVSCFNTNKNNGENVSCICSSRLHTNYIYEGRIWEQAAVLRLSGRSGGVWVRYDAASWRTWPGLVPLLYYLPINHKEIQKLPWVQDDQCQ